VVQVAEHLEDAAAEGNMKKEKCSKCCLDLKYKKFIIECNNRCLKDKGCDTHLISCYTKKHIGA